MTTSVELDLDTLELISAEGDADCEVNWVDQGGICGKPASWHAMVHDFNEHIYIPSRICAGCINQLVALGCEGDTLMCLKCGAKPVMKDRRPI